jgi:hypothetical protein
MHGHWPCRGLHGCVTVHVCVLSVFVATCRVEVVSTHRGHSLLLSTLLETQTTWAGGACSSMQAARELHPSITRSDTH